jgi:hypothetical protein
VKKDKSNPKTFHRANKTLDDEPKISKSVQALVNKVCGDSGVLAFIPHNSTDQCTILTRSLSLRSMLDTAQETITQSVLSRTAVRDFKKLHEICSQS